MSAPDTDPLAWSPDLKVVVWALRVPAFAVHRSDTIVAWNDAAEALFGLPSHVTVGRAFRELPPSYRVRGLRGAIEDVKASGRPVRLDERSVERGDGEMVVDFDVVPLIDGSHTAGVLVTASDRSEVRALTAQLSLTAEELQSTGVRMEATNEELRQVNEALRAGNEELEARLKELQHARERIQDKDDFLAMLAHELRNPLAPIVSALEILRRQADDPDAVGRAREVMERQVRHQTRLLEDLLDVARIARGKIELRPAAVDLASVVAEAVETTRSLIETRQHVLVLATPEEPIRLRADSIRLAQVIANLLSNAAKYTEPGGQIELTATREDESAVVRVRDTGIGIPKDMRSRIFDLFIQAEPSLVRSQGGLGIGLTLVRSLVQMHGGTVEVTSEGPGRGSEFVVRLPLGAPEAIGFSTAEPPAAVASRRILVVEDDQDSRETLRTVLELDGHRVEVAEAGKEGVEAALRNPPEVALIDIGLPGWDGYEVAKRLRAALGGSVAVIALTGYGQPEDRQRAHETGFDAHLVKPVDVDALRRLITSDLRRIR